MTTDYHTQYERHDLKGENIQSFLLFDDGGVEKTLLTPNDDML
jgi:hypothetical protein